MAGARAAADAFRRDHGMPCGFVKRRAKCPKGWKKRSVRIKARGIRYLCKRANPRH
jgi:hypothetical protein